MCRLISAAVRASTSSKSSDAFTSSPISANVASTSAEVSGLSVVGAACDLGSVASMYLLIITGVSRAHRWRSVHSVQFVCDGEPAVVGLHIRDAALHLIQQHRHPQVLRLALFK